MNLIIYLFFYLILYLVFYLNIVVFLLSLVESWSNKN